MKQLEREREVLQRGREKGGARKYAYPLDLMRPARVWQVVNFNNSESGSTHVDDYWVWSSVGHSEVAAESL